MGQVGLSVSIVERRQNGPMNLLLVDDHPLIHVAVRALLADFDPPVTLHSAHSRHQAHEVLQAGLPMDLMLLDLHLADFGDGFALLAELREAHPALPIVTLSGNNQMSEVIRAIDQGAMGFIPKHTDPEEFKQALLLVVGGGVYVPPMKVEDNAPPPASSRSTGETGPALQWRSPQLAQLPITARQQEVLQCLLQGKPNKLIAQELHISAETVKDHVAAVLRALKVSTRTQAVLAVSELMREAPAR